MMNMRHAILPLLLGLLVCNCGPSASAQILIAPDKKAAPEPPHLLKDQPTEAYRLELLGLAWQAATSYPINPHIKNRARAEEQVVHGALELEQPHLAWGYAKKVVNWRKGACHAEIAHYLIEKQDTEHVEYFLHYALLYSKDPKQGWRHQRVKARVASARVLMGLSQESEPLVEDEDGAGKGEQLNALIRKSNNQAYEQYVEILDAMAATEDYEQILAAVSGYAELFVIHYANAERREALLKKTRGLSQSVPGFKQFQFMIMFVEAALKNKDTPNAVALLDEAEAIHDKHSWGLDFDLGQRSEIARYRVAVGDQPAAEKMLAYCEQLADKKLGDLQNWEQARTLRPVAEGYAVLGDRDKAHALYRRVVELGAVNPNIRPRVSDITATCVSMALHGIEPDKKLLSTIKQIVGGLANQ